MNKAWIISAALLVSASLIAAAEEELALPDSEPAAPVSESTAALQGPEPDTVLPEAEPAAIPPAPEQTVLFSGQLSEELSSTLPADSTAPLSVQNLLRLRFVAELAPVKAARAHLDVEVDFAGLTLAADSSLFESVSADLNEAWLRADFTDSLILLAGIRRMAWGTGFFHNPTDFVNPPKDPADPQAQRKGVWSVQAGLYLSVFSFEPAAIIYDRLESTGFTAKLSTSALIPATDLNLVFFYAEPEGIKTGASFDCSPFTDLDVLSGLSFHGEVAASERSERDPGREGWVVSALGGLRFQAPVIDTYLIAEYLYLQDGLELLPLPQAPGIPTVFERGSSYIHNLAFSLMQPNLTNRVSAFTDSLSAQATLLLNPIDGSAMLRAGIGSGFVENCTIQLEGTWFLGAEDTEFGSARTGAYGTYGIYSLTVEVGF